MKQTIRDDCPHGREWWIIAAWLTAVLTASSSAAIPLRSGGAEFSGPAPRDTLFSLPVTWVIMDSVQCEVNGEALAQYVDWRLVEPGNRIWLYRALNLRDTLRVRFWYQPIPIARTHVRRVFRNLARSDTNLVPQPKTRWMLSDSVLDQEGRAWSRLEKSGSLIRSVQIGTGQDLKLESALNVQLNGRVGKDVDVVAALSDQSTPIQPEGTTESLSELEKVFVSVRGQRFSTTIGDYSLDLPGGNYDAYSRKLTGVQGEVSAGNTRLSASGAVSRGQFHTNRFQGQEANQGPYPLRGKRGESGIVVLAGSETVWLDGVQLRRGEGNDYTIDYSSGELRFTARRVITAESRIEVDFEYSVQDYERFYGAGRVSSEFGSGKLAGSATVISESDDRARPIGLALSESDRVILSRSGDVADSAVVAAADSLGSGGGDYVRIDTVSAQEHFRIFVYSPRDSAGGMTGQWRVLFDDFGTGQGDYEATADSRGYTYFNWVGPGRGRFRPYRRLPMPQTHTLADIRLQTSPLPGVTLSGEMAGTGRDLNTFSSVDDGNNEGVAYSAAVALEKERPKVAGWTPHRVGVRAKIRGRDQRFADLARSTEVEFERAWDASSERTSSEGIREFDANISPIRALTLTAGYGDLDRGSLASSVRRLFGAGVYPASRWKVTATHLSIASSDSLSGRRGRWVRQDSRLNGGIGRISPRIAVERESKRNEFRGTLGGFRFLQYNSGVELALPHQLSLDGEYSRRIEDSLQSSNSFSRRSRAYTVSSSAEWRPQAIGQTSLRYAHREKVFANPDSSNITSDVGRLEALVAPRVRFFEANVTYDVARTSTQSRILVAIEVPEGTGSYRREGNQYVPDDQGNYILVPRYTGSYQPATELALNALVALRPDELTKGTLPAWLRVLSSETEFSLGEQTRYPLSVRLVVLDQSLLRGDSTLSGTLALRQDLHVNRVSRKASVRLRYRHTESLQNQFLNGGQQRELREGGLRVRAQYYRNLHGESEAVWSHEALKYMAGTVPSRDLDRIELTQRASVALSRTWEIGVTFSATEARDERTLTQASLREVKPRATISRWSRGRLEGDVAWIHATSNRADIPYELGRGANRGENFRWGLRGSYNFAQSFTSTISYEGREDAGEQTYHLGRLEVRASF